MIAWQNVNATGRDQARGCGGAWFGCDESPVGPSCAASAPRDPSAGAGMKKRSRFASGPVRQPHARQQRGPSAAVIPSALMTLFGHALALHQAGRLTEAEPLYAEVLRVQPRHFDSLHLLGVVHHQRGRYEEALRRIDAALRENPGAAAAHNNRGAALKELGRLPEALASYDKAV